MWCPDMKYLRCFNPCYRGILIWGLTAWVSEKAEKRVSILVIVEY